MGKVVKIYNLFQAESDSESKRIANMTIDERFAEFSSLQERVWGTKWTQSLLVKTVTYEKVSWFKQ